jgi:3-phosphoshikimate 1-carboxyvinyltransferase
MHAIIKPGYIKGTVKVPASKSMMQRACAAALLHSGKTIIHNPGTSKDDKAALNIIQQLGAEVKDIGNSIEITSQGIQPTIHEVDCAESGLSARLFIPIAAMAGQEMSITGSGSLLKRPMNVFSELLPQLGVEIVTENNCLPITVKGPLQPKNIKLDGSVSSQFLSGLLFAYSYAAKEAVTIEVSDLKSKPYIDLTLDVLKQFGKAITNNNYTSFHIDPTVFSEPGEINITIEGDWSSAAGIMVAAALSGHVTLTGLNSDSAQADKAIIKALQAAGAHVHVSPEYVEVKKAFPLYPFEFDATDCPDLFPVLAILASCCNGESSIHGVHRLFYKESNRLVSIGDMLQQFGIFFSVEGDTMVIEGLNQLEYATIDSYNDHRIIMAAVAGSLRATAPVVITDAQVVDKSYPDFFTDLSSLEAAITLKQDRHE